MQNDPLLLKQMLDDQEQQNSLYRPGHYWQLYQKRIVAELKTHGLEDFRRQPGISKGYADILVRNPFAGNWPANSFKFKLLKILMALPVLRTIRAGYEKLINVHIKRALKFQNLYFQARFPNGLAPLLGGRSLPDTLHGGSENKIFLDGEDHASIYIRYLLEMQAFDRHGANLRKTRTAMEIGGGFGGFMHLLLAQYPNIKKIIYIDIPPVIYVSTQYLKHFFGAAVYDYSQTRHNQRLSFKPDDSLEIFCLCPWQIENLVDANVDTFFNIASFSEMGTDIVQNYARHLRRLVAANGKLCLFLNKGEEKAQGIAPANDILQSFNPEFSFAHFDPQDPFIRTSYWIGSRN